MAPMVDSHWAEMMTANNVGDVKERYASATVVTRRAFGGGGGVPAWEGVSSQYRTALHFVNGTMTSPYYPNNIINPVIVPLHEQHGPNFIFMDNNGTFSGDWGTSNRVACTFSRPESHRRPIGSAEPPCKPLVSGCHASADNKSTCEQHETSLSSCNWCSRAYKVIETLTFFVVVYPPMLLAFVAINCLRWGNHQCMLLLKCPTFMI